MPLDTTLFYTFLLVFVRTGAMFLTSPVFGAANVPVPIRVGLSGMISLALAPILREYTGILPASLIDLTCAIAKEAIIGGLLGYLATLIIIAAETAGLFLDLQIGFGMISVLNPQTQTPSTLLGSFKIRLATLLFLALNGHHLLLRALVKSYSIAPSMGMVSLHHTTEYFSNMMGETMLLAVEIAAPAAATLIIADMALAAVSKAVPQMNVFIVGAPAKIIVGLLALAFGLPAMAWAISNALESSSGLVGSLFQALK